MDGVSFICKIVLVTISTGSTINSDDLYYGLSRGTPASVVGKSAFSLTDCEKARQGSATSEDSIQVLAQCVNAIVDFAGHVTSKRRKSLLANRKYAQDIQEARQVVSAFTSEESEQERRFKRFRAKQAQAAQVLLERLGMAEDAKTGSATPQGDTLSSGSSPTSSVSDAPVSPLEGALPPKFAAEVNSQGRLGNLPVQAGHRTLHPSLEELGQSRPTGGAPRQSVQNHLHASENENASQLHLITNREAEMVGLQDLASSTKNETESKMGKPMLESLRNFPDSSLEDTHPVGKYVKPKAPELQSKIEKLPSKGKGQLEHMLLEPMQRPLNSSEQLDHFLPSHDHVSLTSELQASMNTTAPSERLLESHPSHSGFKHSDSSSEHVDRPANDIHLQGREFQSYVKSEGIKHDGQVENFALESLANDVHPPNPSDQALVTLRSELQASDDNGRAASEGPTRTQPWQSVHASLNSSADQVGKPHQINDIFVQTQVSPSNADVKAINAIDNGTLMFQYLQSNLSLSEQVRHLRQIDDRKLQAPDDHAVLNRQGTSDDKRSNNLQSQSAQRYPENSAEHVARLASDFHLRAVWPQSNGSSDHAKNAGRFDGLAPGSELNRFNSSEHLMQLDLARENSRQTSALQASGKITGSTDENGVGRLARQFVRNSSDSPLEHLSHSGLDGIPLQTLGTQSRLNSYSSEEKLRNSIEKEQDVGLESLVAKQVHVSASQSNGQVSVSHGDVSASVVNQTSSTIIDEPPSSRMIHMYPRRRRRRQDTPAERVTRLMPQNGAHEEKSVESRRPQQQTGGEQVAKQLSPRSTEASRHEREHSNARRKTDHMRVRADSGSQRINAIASRKLSQQVNREQGTTHSLQRSGEASSLPEKIPHRSDARRSSYTLPSAIVGTASRNKAKRTQYAADARSGRSHRPRLLGGRAGHRSGSRQNVDRRGASAVREAAADVERMLDEAVPEEALFPE